MNLPGDNHQFDLGALGDFLLDNPVKGAALVERVLTAGGDAYRLRRELLDPLIAIQNKLEPNSALSDAVITIDSISTAKSISSQLIEKPDATRIGLQHYFDQYRTLENLNPVAVRGMANLAENLAGDADLRETIFKRVDLHLIRDILSNCWKRLRTATIC